MMHIDISIIARGACGDEREGLMGPFPREELGKKIDQHMVTDFYS
jgi:hypothetical protein